MVALYGMLYKIRNKNLDKGTAEQIVFLKFVMYVYFIPSVVDIRYGPR